MADKVISDVVGVPNPRSDWNQTDDKKSDYIKNKPKIYTRDQVDSLLNDKVTVEKGKQLSSNDFTDEDKGKINSLIRYTNEIAHELDNVVHKEEGKGLSSNDFTDKDRYALDIIVDAVAGEERRLVVRRDDFTLSLNGNSFEVDSIGNLYIYADELGQWMPAQLATFKDKIARGKLENKVDKQEGMGLSSKDFTAEYKDMLDKKTRDARDVGTGKTNLVTSGVFHDYVHHYLNNKVDKQEGMGLSEESFTKEDKQTLENLSNYFANSVNTNKNGNVILLDDVLPVEHKMNVKLSNANTTLNIYGKNLFNNDTSLIDSVEYTPINGNPTSRFGYIITLPCGSYTMRAIRKDTFNNDYIYGMILDESNMVVQSGLNIVVNNACKVVTFEIKSGQKLFVYNGSSTSTLGATRTMFSNYDIQLEVGENATEFESYIAPITYIPNSDGTVDGVRIIYPSMTLVPNEQGVLIDVEYCRDINKVLESITKAIISLGGNV